jgi:hypothetical protein
MRAISDKADRLIAMHVPQGHDTCATVSAADEQQDSDLVAATGGARRKKKLPPHQRPQQQQGGLGQRGDPPCRRSAHFDVFLPCQIRRAGQVLRGRVPVAGKLGCRDVVSAVRPGRLFYITDSVSSRRYLVDTGSAFSIMPWESSDTPCGPNLTAADSRRIPCWGERPFTVTIGGVPRRWSFLLAAVSFPHHRYRLPALSQPPRGCGQSPSSSWGASGGGCGPRRRAWPLYCPAKLLHRGGEGVRFPLRRISFSFRSSSAGSSGLLIGGSVAVFRLFSGRRRRPRIGEMCLWAVFRRVPRTHHLRRWFQSPSFSCGGYRQFSPASYSPPASSLPGPV